jgi:hypothetical protein
MGCAMSLWIRKRGEGRQRWYFAVELPIGLILIVVPTVLFAFLGNLLAAPIQTLLCCFAVAGAGSVLIGVSKWALLRQGIFMSFGSAGMSPRARVLYRVGWLLFIIGVAATLLGIAVAPRH